MKLCILCFLLSAFVIYPADKTGYIKARGKPTGAGLFVDGKYIGPAGRFTVPEKYALDPGEHTISFQDPRFEEYTTKVVIQPGKTTKVSYSLKRATPAPPPYGRLRFGGGESESFISVTAGDTSPVYINEKFYGFIDELNNVGGGLLLPPGTYNVKSSSPIFGNINETVTIQANQVTVIGLKSASR
jgi:hypothetical protein